MKPLAPALPRIWVLTALGAWASCSSSGPGVGAEDAGAVQHPPAEAGSDGDATSPSSDASGDAIDAAAGLWWSMSPAAEVAVAATNDTLAVAYVEQPSGSGATSEGRLMLQVRDGDLNARGAAQEIDRQPVGNVPPIPSVATDGVNFLVCWSPLEQVRCLAAGGSTDSPPLFQTGGVSPTIAFHGETWALAYVASPSRSQMNEARVVRFSREGASLGDPAAFPYDAYFGRPVSFVSTPSGFALLAGQTNLSLYRLTPELSVDGTPVDTGLGTWGYHTLAASDDEAAMALAKPYGNVLLHVRGSEVVLRQERGCGAKGGCDTAVALQGDTFAVAWWSASGQFSYFADINHAGTSADVLADNASSTVLVPYGSRLVVVSKGAP